MHAYVHCSISYLSQGMEATQVSINRPVDKKEVVHIYNGILLIHKKELNLTICETWTDKEGIVLSEINRTEKENARGFHLHVESKDQNK